MLVGPQHERPDISWSAKQLSRPTRRAARALAEIRRILQPGGHLVCVWNVRDESVEWVRSYSAVVGHHAGDTPRHHTMAWRRTIEADPELNLVDEFVIDNPKPSSPDDVAARALSTSFIAALDAPVRQEAIDEIRRLTDPLGPDFDFPYRSELQAWTYRPGSTSST